MFASKVCREFSKKTKAQRLWVCVTVRPDRSAAPWRGRIVSTTDSGHYGVWGGASNEAALDGRLRVCKVL